MYAALETLAAYNLAVRRDGRWHVAAGTSLVLLAEQFGCVEEIETQLGRHRAERAAYRVALGLISHQRPSDVSEPDSYAWDEPAWPPDIGWTVLDLVQHRLGARIIA